MKRIFLIGYMGTGKTTVGKDLAKRMNLSFIDLDSYIEGRYHKTVGQLFEEGGEAFFREIEQKMLHEVSTFEDVILSTGGGAPCFFDNIDFMKQAGVTVFLKVEPDELVNRLKLFKQNRPLIKDLADSELKAFIVENLRKRDPYYMQAEIVFDADVMTTEGDVEDVCQTLEKILNARYTESH